MWWKHKQGSWRGVGLFDHLGRDSDTINETWPSSADGGRGRTTVSWINSHWKWFNINIKTTQYQVEYSLIFSSILALFLLWLCRLWITSSYRLKFFLAFWTLIEFWPSRRVLYCLNKSLRSSDLWTCRVGLKLIWETEQHGKIKGK